MGVEVTMELITYDSYSQEMSFIPYLFVFLLLMSSHGEISLNRTLLRHANIKKNSDCMHLTVKYEAKIGCLHIYINIHIYVLPGYINIPV
jgi:hypothetical protein